MIVNTQWLLEYLEPGCSHDQLVDAFTTVGLEVEESIQLSSELKNIVIGFVRDKKPIPELNGMYHCQVEVGPQEMLSIVCASEHEIEIGWGVPVAKSGTHLPTGKEIGSSQFKGVLSAGMICLDGEMGMLARGSGLQVFQDESALGKSLPELIEIPEYLVELAILPNRPDCLGMIGIAREIAAALGLSLKYPATTPIDSNSAGNVPVTVEEPQLCPRYMCRLIEGVQVAPSPHWLKSRLLAAGKRPINNVVDITNYVLLEWGQPLHAFDFNLLQGREIRVRRMESSEQLELLDGTTVDGKSNPLVIADQQRPVALAGIMGGKDTETTEQSTDVLMEAAYFDPVMIRKTVKQLGIGTDSSYRFERGTDPNKMLLGALFRACDMIADLAGGKLHPTSTDIYSEEKQPATVQLSSNHVGSYFGEPVDEKTIQKCLVDLEMECSDDLKVTVPTWRVDVNDPVVLIEDVVRHIGYDKVPRKSMVATVTSGQRCTMDVMRSRISDYLMANGFLEARHRPLVDTTYNHIYADSQHEIRLRNPLRSDMNVLRNSLLFSLTETVEHNARRGAEHFRFFEVDRVFSLAAGDPVEAWTLAAILGGKVLDSDWMQSAGETTFYHAKGILEGILRLIGISTWETQPGAQNGFVPERSAAIVHNNQTVATLGLIDRAKLPKSKSRTPLYALELNLSALVEEHPQVPAYSAIARQPAVTRDISIEVDQSVAYAQLERAIRKVAGNMLGTMRCVDNYTGKQIRSGSKSVTINLQFRDPSRSMTADEGSQLIDQIVQQLQAEFKATLRI